MRYYLSREKLQHHLAEQLPRLDKLLIVLFWDNEAEKTPLIIKKIASDNGLRECKKWNVTDILSGSKGKATSIGGKWILTAPGKAYLAQKEFISKKQSKLANDVADLRARLSSIGDANTKEFLEEAISCLEIDQNRAAVVLSWIGAISLLYDHIVKNQLSAFNSEAKRRDVHWKNAKTPDDFTRMKEHEFLNVLEAISVIGKNVRQELQQCLHLRNACGHPNSLKIGERKVAAHIEILVLNVFSKF